MVSESVAVLCDPKEFQDEKKQYDLKVLEFLNSRKTVFHICTVFLNQLTSHGVKNCKERLTSRKKDLENDICADG